LEEFNKAIGNLSVSTDTLKTWGGHGFERVRNGYFEGDGLGRAAQCAPRGRPPKGGRVPAGSLIARSADSPHALHLPRRSSESFGLFGGGMRVVCGMVAGIWVCCGLFWSL
jgi:hypothetical protein